MLPACSRNTAADAKPQAKPVTSPTTSQATPPPAAAELAPPPVKPIPAQLPEIVARVNGEAINKNDLENAVKEGQLAFQSAQAAYVNRKAELESALLSQQSDVASIQAAYTKAELTLEAQEKLYKDQLVSEIQLKQSRSDASELENRLKIAKSRLEIQTQGLKSQLAPAFEALGLKLDTVTVQNVSLPEELQKILDQKIGMGMVGDMGKFMQYQTAQSIPALAAGAGGGEGGGGIVGSAVGLGAGVALGQTFANQLSQGLNAAAVLACGPRARHNGPMPRTGRAAVGGYCYHVMNRGNERAEAPSRGRSWC